MSTPAFPAKTYAARVLLAGARATLGVQMRMLLINVNGRRGVAELQEIAQSLNLGRHALDELRRDGYITGAEGMGAATAAAEPAPAAAPATAASGDSLRRLMKAKMFAFDLACRMLAGRDAELRCAAREVDNESSFLDWLSEASARIEAASDAERARWFRERVAQAAV